MTTVEDDSTAHNSIHVNVYTPLAANARVTAPVSIFSGRFTFEDAGQVVAAKEVCVGNSTMYKGGLGFFVFEWKSFEKYL
jgi:hypothetical protein